MADGGMHPHYRAALIAAGISALALGATVFAAVAPLPAEVTGIAAGGVAALAGGQWAARKLGFKPKGQRWRARMSRTKAARLARSGIIRTGKLARSLPGAGKLRRVLGRASGGRAGPGRGGLLSRLGRHTGSGKRLGRLWPFGHRTAGTGSGKTSKPAFGRRALAALRRPFRRPGKGPGGASQGGRPSPPAASRSRLGRAARAVRGTWRRARKTTGGRKAKGWRKAAGIAGAAALMPLFGAAGAARSTRARHRPPAKPAQKKPATVPGKKKQQAKSKKPVPAAVPRTARPALVRRTVFYGGKPMNQIDAAAEAAEQNIGGWEPENAADLDRFLAGLPDFFNAVGKSFASVASTLAERYPVNPAVVERLRDIGATIRGMSEFSAEAHAIHRTVHDRELERIENPRPGEDLWDVTQQQ